MATIRVKADYPTIQAAVDAAAPSDVILVENGVYSEQVTVGKSFIKITGGEKTVLDGKMVLDTGFILDGVSGVRISSFIIRRYRNNGINVTGTANENTIEKNQIWDIENYGVALYPGSANTLVSCCCISRSYGGILNQDSNLTVKGCKLSYNGQCGMLSYGNAEICGNIFFYNFQNGIETHGPGDRIARNQFCGNANGLYLDANSKSLAEENEFSENTETGISAMADGAVIKHNKIWSNEIGIYMGGRFNSITGNHVTGNSQNGIVIESFLNVIEGNIAEENAVYDIKRLSASNTLKNNRCGAGFPPRVCKGCNIQNDSKRR
jgi:nitrous oxidase accessory protein NosD